MRVILFIAVLFIAVLPALAQYAPQFYGVGSGSRLDDVTPEPRLASNVIIDILATDHPDTLWLATGEGVTRLIAADRGGPFDSSRFETFGEAQGLGKGGTSGLLWTDSIIWASFAFDTSVGVSGAGGGLAYSRDDGRNWTWLPQPRDRMHPPLEPNGFDPVLGYWPTTTNVDNITYDIAMSDSFVWIASKGGGLRRHAFAADYTDFDSETGWQVIDTLVLEPDGTALPFHPGDPGIGLIHRPFSVIYAAGAVWQGTAAGILRSTNNGRTWRQFHAQNSGISGNFITAMAYNAYDSTIWAATWRAESPNEFYAVSKSTDNGTTWTAHLTPEQVQAAIGEEATVRAHSFAFDGGTVYVADDLGLWKSVDGGASWDLLEAAHIRDVTGRGFYEAAVYSALVDSADRLWVGGVNGLGVSLNEGGTWEVFQSHRALDNGERPVDTYAAPNPWSPSRFRPVWLWYTNPAGGSVKITIYDFSMTEVVELPAVTRGPGEQYEIWDGRKEGTIVANGTYFYRIDKPGGEVWGKLIVLD